MCWTKGAELLGQATGGPKLSLQQGTAVTRVALGLGTTARHLGDPGQCPDVGAGEEGMVAVHGHFFGVQQGDGRGIYAAQGSEGKGPREAQGEGVKKPA